MSHFGKRSDPPEPLLAIRTETGANIWVCGYCDMDTGGEMSAVLEHLEIYHRWDPFAARRRINKIRYEPLPVTHDIQ